MNLKQIRELAQIVETSGLSSLDIQEGDTHIILKRECAPMPVAAAAPLPAVAEALAAEEGVDFNDVTGVVSPMVGVFYAASAPAEKPFVAVGDRVKKGDVLCVIEAMKLMNEITADRDGEVVDICVQNGDMVEYGQTLFKLF